MPKIASFKSTAAWATGSSTSTLAHATACYYYDARGSGFVLTNPEQKNGRRVWRTGFTNDHNCGGDTTGQRGYIYDLAGRWLSSVNKVSGTSCLSEIYAGSRHVASDNGDTTLDHTDWLGTSRVRTDYQYTSSHGFWIGQSCTSLPFGDGLDCSSSNYFALHFTGKERDSESNLDNFGARYSSSSLGRFMSADWSSIPVAVPYANLTNPQTLNLYALVADNPETFADLDGHGGCASLEVSTTCSWDAYQEGLAGDVIEGWQCNKEDVCDPAGDRQAANDQNAQEAQNQTSDPVQQVIQEMADRKQKAIADLKRPYTDQDKANMFLQAGKMGDAGVNAAMLATAPEYITMGVLVATDAGVVEVGKNVVQGVKNVNEELIKPAGQRVGATLETRVPGGVKAATDFARGALSPRNAPRSPAGVAGAVTRVVVDTLIKMLSP